MTGERTKTQVKATNAKAKIPNKFQPKFWELTDGRLVSVKFIKKLVNQLKRDAGCDSVQKELLAERAAFLALQLQSQEITCVEGGDFDTGVYTQQVNALSGLLSKLGLTKAPPKSVGELEEYVNGEWQ